MPERISDFKDIIQKMDHVGYRCQAVIAGMKTDSEHPSPTNSTIRPTKPPTIKPPITYVLIGRVSIPIPSYFEVDRPPMYGT